ncbi:MAG: FadR family transcriptional regulator [Bifidobacteriaceae bacterium]|jgi:GntR family transcriptional repressor for pyruvate dehydrogenase complex|nr:FadR family transcriptional regulator [Bifidobacteriaceae bacterium]
MARSKDVNREFVLNSIEERAPFHTRAGNNAAEDIANRIQTLIIKENLHDGARLPSERDLAEHLATSRPTVSQAIRTLVVRGLVESRRGSGNYVIRHPEASLAAAVDLMLNLNTESVNHLAELRLLLESAGIDTAVDRGTPDDFADAEKALGQIRTCTGNTAAWMTADTRFHAALVRASKNPYLFSIYESVHTALISYEYRAWVRSGQVPSWLGKAGADDMVAIHEPILRAVKARDAQAAREAVQQHHRIMAMHLADALPGSPEA